MKSGVGIRGRRDIRSEEGKIHENKHKAEIHTDHKSTVPHLPPPLTPGCREAPAWVGYVEKAILLMLNNRGKEPDPLREGSEESYTPQLGQTEARWSQVPLINSPGVPREGGGGAAAREPSAPGNTARFVSAPPTAIRAEKHSQSHLVALTRQILPSHHRPPGR